MRERPGRLGPRQGRRVRRRHVFYVPGYDPRGPSHYHRLYGEEAAKQAAINGLALGIGPRRKVSEIESAWRVASETTVTDYSFLRYDDLIRARWTKGNVAVLVEILRATFLFIIRGSYWRVLFVSWPTLLTMLYPPALVLLAAVLALVAGFVIGMFVSVPAGLAVTAAVFAGCVALRAPLEDRINAFWLARILAFIADQGSENMPDLDERLDRFAARIAAVVTDDMPDEVLVAAHSVGTQLAVSVAARVLRQVPEARLSLLTLGQTITLQALQPGAIKFRAELAEVSASPMIDWIDVSAAIDSACFPLTDPLTSSGLTQARPACPKPKLVSARFPRLFSTETYARLKRNFRRAHFQYLMAAELAGDYDYFLITAGDRRLADRFGHLASVTNFNRFRLGKS